MIKTITLSDELILDAWERLTNNNIGNWSYNIIYAQNYIIVKDKYDPKTDTWSERKAIDGINNSILLTKSQAKELYLILKKEFINYEDVDD